MRIKNPSVDENPEPESESSIASDLVIVTSGGYGKKRNTKKKRNAKKRRPTKKRRLRRPRNKRKTAARSHK